MQWCIDAMLYSAGPAGPGVILDPPITHFYRFIRTVSDSPSSTPSQTPAPASTMTAHERRSAFSLASIYALRMLGLFMVLPVFSLEAQHYHGGDNEVAVGFAIGMYGLVQACLQIPFGLAADRFGRKRVIVLGLLCLALGSMIAAMADSVQGLAIGRGIQGGGAISAAVSALLADQTRTEVRTKGMALIGASIGLMFALSLGGAAAHLLVNVFTLDSRHWGHPLLDPSRRPHTPQNCTADVVTNSHLGLQPRFTEVGLRGIYPVRCSTRHVDGPPRFAHPSRHREIKPWLVLFARRLVIFCRDGGDFISHGAKGPFKTAFSELNFSGVFGTVWLSL
jgi:Major Facilitator Superfamily